MKIKRKLALRTIVALRTIAQQEAAMSQAPDLIEKEHTQEWHDADAIESAMKEQAALKASVQHPSKSLTCNQLVLLLQLYRGTLALEHKPGTHKNDLARLKEAGCILVSSSAEDIKFCLGWTLSLSGKQRCEAALQ